MSKSRIDLIKEMDTTLHASRESCISEYGKTSGELLFTLLRSDLLGPENFRRIEKISAYEDYIFNRCAPFRRHDFVELTKEIDFENSPGWVSSKGFLRPGVAGRVEEVSFSDSKFAVGVRWVNQTWVDSQGKESPVEPRRWAIYLHPSGSLKALSPEKSALVGELIQRLL